MSPIRRPTATVDFVTFDFNGVLAGDARKAIDKEPNDAYVEATLKVFDALDLPRPKHFMNVYGRGGRWDDLVIEAQQAELRKAGRLELTSIEITDLQELAEEKYQAGYDQIMRSWAVRLSPGAAKSVEALTQARARVAVISAQDVDSVLHLMRNGSFGDARYDETLQVIPDSTKGIKTRNVIGSVHDKAKEIAELAKRFETTADHGLYVGDQISDANFAKKAGIPMLAYPGMHSLADFAVFAKQNPETPLYFVNDLEDVAAFREVYNEVVAGTKEPEALDQYSFEGRSFLTTREASYGDLMELTATYVSRFQEWDEPDAAHHLLVDCIENDDALVQVVTDERGSIRGALVAQMVMGSEGPEVGVGELWSNMPDGSGVGSVLTRALQDASTQHGITRWTTVTQSPERVGRRYASQVGAEIVTADPAVMTRQVRNRSELAQTQFAPAFWSDCSGLADAFKSAHPDEQWSDETARERVEAMLGGPLWLATRSGKIVGAASAEVVTTNAGPAYVNAYAFTAPEARSEGVATQLLACLAEEAKGTGITQISGPTPTEQRSFANQLGAEATNKVLVSGSVADLSL